MPNWLKYALGITLLLLLLAQLVPVDRSVPELEAQADFLNLTEPPAPVAQLIRDACYDCHSYTSEYPWYARVAPVAQWIQQHIDDGRKHLNFAIWSEYPAKKQSHKLEECVEMLQSGEMPLQSFTWLHPEARLTPAQREELVVWFERQHSWYQSNENVGLRPAQ